MSPDADATITALSAPLDGRRLLHCWHGAAAALLAQRGRLDQANVFPVADGDTGTNMAATLAEAVAACAPLPHAGQLQDALAAAALGSSRGNSGIILAQFLGGLAAGLDGTAQLDARALAAAAGPAVASARAAVAEPVEGTVLTVMAAWAEALTAACPDGTQPDLAAVLTQARDAAAAALARTPTQLSALADAGVVDAGADGFVCLLGGFCAALATSPEADDALPDADAPLPATLHADHHPARLPAPPSLRWCTEILLEDTAASPEQVRAVLADLGDSVIAAGRAPRLKVHLHTNDPHLAAARLRAHGRLGPQKVEDMRLQYAAHHGPAAAVGLVTDSACDLPAALRERFQVHEVPLTIQWQEHEYIDGRTLTASDFYAELGRLPVHPRTSQPPLTRFERLYGDLLDCHEHLLSLHLSARMSGTFGAARLAAERAGRGRVHCIDTRRLSAALGLVVLGTAEALADGAGVQRARAMAADLATRTEMFVVVASLESMVRGGRISAGVGRAARVSGLRPLVSVSQAGTAAISGAAFSVAGLERQMLARLRRGRRRRGAPVRWAVVHAAAAPAAARITAEAADLLGSEPAWVMETAPILGAHVGLGSYGIAVTWR
jgi:DegV family protein with EDD domain